MPLAPLLRAVWLGSGGSNEVLSASRGMTSCGGIYAGYLDVISCRKKW